MVSCDISILNSHSNPSSFENFFFSSLGQKFFLAGLTFCSEFCCWVKDCCTRNTRRAPPATSEQMTSSPALLTFHLFFLSHYILSFLVAVPSRYTQSNISLVFECVTRFLPNLSLH